MEGARIACAVIGASVIVKTYLGMLEVLGRHEAGRNGVHSLRRPKVHNELAQTHAQAQQHHYSIPDATRRRERGEQVAHPLHAPAGTSNSSPVATVMPCPRLSGTTGNRRRRNTAAFPALGVPTRALPSPPSSRDDNMAAAERHSKLARRSSRASASLSKWHEGGRVCVVGKFCMCARVHVCVCV